MFRYARSPYADASLRDGFKFVARMITGPSAEQGLLIARDHYERLGGYRPDSRRSETRNGTPGSASIQANGTGDAEQSGIGI